MKSERRHELEKNELADRLATGIESTRSFLPVALAGLAVLAVAAIVWGLYSNYSKQQASVAWTDFYFNLTGGDADSFVDLADDHPKSAAAGWARQVAGDNYLQRGITELYRNKAAGQELLEKAIKAFEEVDKSTTNSELRSKAALGLAQAHESLGETDKAASYYQQVAKSAVQPGLIMEANQRLSFLASDSGKEFYAWFKTQDPKPDAPISLPSDMLVPPTTPNLQFGPSDSELNSSSSPGVQAEVDSSSYPALPAGANAAAADETSPQAETPGAALPAATGVPAVSQVPAIPEVPANEVPGIEPPAAAESSTNVPDVPATDGLELKP